MSLKKWIAVTLVASGFTSSIVWAAGMDKPADTRRDEK